MEQKYSDVLNTTSEYLSNFIVGINNASEALQKNEVNEAFDVIYNLNDGLEWLLEAIKAIRNYNKSEETDDMDFLNEINEAIENQDFILLNDLLIYELAPLAEKWIQEINELLVS